MRFLVWGAARSAARWARIWRAPATTSRSWTRPPTTWPRSTAHGLRITGPIADFTVRVPAFTPDTLTGEWDTVILATKAHHTEPPSGRSRSTPERRRVRDLRAERAQRTDHRRRRRRRADRGRVRQLRRGLPRAGRHPLRRPRGGRRRRDRRPHDAAGDRDSRCLARVRRARDRHAEHLGLPVGQGSLRRHALRHRPHQRLDRRRARDAGVPRRCTSRWPGRSSPSPRRAASRPRRSTASTRGLSARRPRRRRRAQSLDALVAHNRARPRRTAASGATSRSGSAPPKSTPNSASS